MRGGGGRSMGSVFMLASTGRWLRSYGPRAPLIGRLSREEHGWAKWGFICGLPLPMPMLLELGRHGAGIAGCTALGGRRFDGTFATVNQSGWIGGW